MQRLNATAAFLEGALDLDGQYLIARSVQIMRQPRMRVLKLRMVAACCKKVDGGVVALRARPAMPGR